MRWCPETWETNAGFECPVCEEFFLPEQVGGLHGNAHLPLDRGPDVDAHGRCYSDALAGF
jgi:hypothetical protein